MYRFIFALVLLTSCSLKPTSQTSAATPPGKNPVKSRKTGDTIYISSEISKGDYCAVYIEKNRQSEPYQHLLDFKMDSDEQVTYKQNYEATKVHHPSPYKIYDLSGLPKEWVPLYLYKGKYYVYHPSDPGNMGRRIVTDSTLVYWFMDGPYPQPFKSVKKLNEHTWSLGIHPFIGNSDMGTKKIMIHIIDPKNKIAIWEDPSETNGRYELYVPRENAKNFDIVVNFCKENKTDEFVFDEPDYKALLKDTK